MENEALIIVYLREVSHKQDKSVLMPISLPMPDKPTSSSRKATEVPMLSFYQIQYRLMEINEWPQKVSSMPRQTPISGFMMCSHFLPTYGTKILEKLATSLRQHTHLSKLFIANVTRQSSQRLKQRHGQTIMLLGEL